MGLENWHYQDVVLTILASSLKDRLAAAKVIMRNYQSKLK